MRYASYEGRSKSEAVDKMFMHARSENRVKETMLIRTYSVDKPKWFGLRKETVWVATACIDDGRIIERQKRSSARRSDQQGDDLFRSAPCETPAPSTAPSEMRAPVRTAATAQALLEKSPAIDQKVQALESDMKKIQSFIQEQMEQMKEAILRNEVNEGLRNKTKIIQDIEISQKNIEWAAEFLREREFHPTLVKDVCEHLKQQKNDVLIDKSQVLTTVRDFLKSSIPREDINIENYGCGRNILFAGPTGVGKTVTIIKMAAHVAMIRQKKLRFISIDRYKVGADSQLKTYADLMKAPFHPISKQDQFNELLEKTECDFTFIDTAGKSPKDTIVIKELSDWLKKSGAPFDVHLVVSFTTKPRDLDLIVNSYSLLDFSHILATKRDETDSLGSILSVSYLTQKPLSFVTVGQEVPQDFEIANIDKMISDALK